MATMTASPAEHSSAPLSLCEGFRRDGKGREPLARPPRGGADTSASLLLLVLSGSRCSLNTGKVGK